MPVFVADSALPLVVAGQAGFAALLFATLRTGNATANRLLALLFAIFALNMGKVAVYASGAVTLLPHLARATYPLELLYGPLFWTFTRVTVGYPLTRRDAVHLTPAIVALLFLLPFYLESGDAKRTVMLAAQQHRSVGDWLLWVGNWGTLSAYIMATVHTLRAHELRVRGELSTIGPEALQWLQRLALAMLAAQAIELLFVAAAGVLHLPPGSPFLNTLALLGVSCTVATLALRQPALRFHDAEPVTTTPERARATEMSAHASPEAASAASALPRPLSQPDTKYARSGLSTEDVARIAARLETHMQAAAPWRDSALSLTTLARQLQVPSHHLSRALNDVLQQSFFDYVNRHRVAEVQRLLADSRQASRSILELAFTAGFNSKSSFNVAFKLVTGETPRAYRSAHGISEGAVSPRTTSA